jgi:peroxiredoxin
MSVLASSEGALTSSEDAPIPAQGAPRLAIFSRPANWPACKAGNEEGTLHRKNVVTISPLSVGEPAPWFSAETVSDRPSTVAFDELAGRHIVLFFFGTSVRPDVAEVLSAFARRDDLFDHKRALLVGISNDPIDFVRGCVHRNRPGQLFCLDSSGRAAKQYGLANSSAAVAAEAIRPVAFIVSPALQIVEIVPLADPAGFIERIVSLLNELPAKSPNAQCAPVLIVPRVFDHAFCRDLIDLYEAAGGREIGAVESHGKIDERFDPKFRKRLDYYISDDRALQRTKEMLARRLLPMVDRAFQFHTTRIERYLVGCYDAATGGYFRPHRDNTAPIVAHRRFAVTINLNDDYEGGDLCFPEFGHQTFHTPPGTAIVFSCSLLHEVTAVTRDRRFAFLSFLYDEPSQQLRDAYEKKRAGLSSASGPGAARA